jgi:hypothetical protein
LCFSLAIRALVPVIIAPRKTELLDDKVIRHLWHCPQCRAVFESFPRFPANAKLVKEVMKSVDVFPPLNT